MLPTTEKTAAVFRNRDGNQRDDNDNEARNKSIVNESLTRQKLITSTIILILMLAIVITTAVPINPLIKTINIGGALIAIGIILRRSFIRIPVNCLGLLESFFSGRFASTDSEENRRILHIPFNEGFHFKPFWWSCCVIDRKVITREITTKKYQTEDGFVWISGLIEYRYSARALFRVPDVDETSIGPGFDALIDDYLGQKTGLLDTETCRTRQGDLNKGLRRKLTALSKKPPRYINGERLRESEVKYATEILTVQISTVDPPEEIQTIITERLKEKHEIRAQETEREALKADLESFTNAGANPNLALKMAMKRQNKLPDGMTDERIEIDAKDSLTGLAGAFLSKLGGKKS